MTVKEAATKLEISPALVYSLIAAGKLRYCRVGHGRGRIRIQEDAIGEYLARCTFAAKDEKPVQSMPRLKHIQF